MPASAKDRALRLLGVRSRSRKELRGRLAKAGFPEDEIAPALDDLERVGLLDDERFAEEVVRDRMGRRGFGPRGALEALRTFGVPRDVAERAVEAWSGDEERAADEVARSRLRRLAGLPPGVASRRLLGFLLRRGFDPEVARAACRRALASEEPLG
jgi:regulatory protein